MNNPCDICVTKHKPQFGEGYCLYQNGGVMGDTCPKRDKYLGYQEGLAEAESRVKAREREMVEWLLDRGYQEGAPLIVCLRAWLGKE